MRIIAVVTIIIVGTVHIACRQDPAQPDRRQIEWSGWIEESAAKRGYVKPGDFAQFGCPPGWHAVEDTAAALRGREVSTIYMGTDPPPREGSITCVAQTEFALPHANIVNASQSQQPVRQPLSPVWVDVGADGTTIGFRSELPLGAAIYIARDTPCGPRTIGVRLGDLLKWLVDPQAATKRDFLGMISAGCPERIAPD